MMLRGLAPKAARPFPDLIGVLRDKAPALETLSIPAFRTLWTGHGLAQLANNTRMMVIAWLTLEMTDSQIWVGLVNGLPAIALAFFALWGGVLADRSSPRTILLRTRLTTALAALVTAFLASVGVIQVWHILVLSFLIGGIAGMDFVVYRVMTAATVEKNRLLNALTLSSIARNLATILGPAIGGILLAQVGPALALWVVAGVFVMAMLAVRRLPQEATIKKNNSSPIQDLLAGFRYA